MLERTEEKDTTDISIMSYQIDILDKNNILSVIYEDDKDFITEDFKKELVENRW